MFLLLLLLPLSIFAKELTLCYKAYYAFFSVAKTCITYKLQGDDLVVSSYVKTINVGGFVKRVYNYGYAVISAKNLIPKEFSYHQEEGEFKRKQHYLFKNSKIYVKETHYVELTDKVEREEERVYPFEGLTEFLPVSSTGHLILVAHLLGLDHSEFTKSFLGSYL
jgi:hypothetical protein